MFNDEYNIDDDFQELKKLMGETEVEIYTFIGRSRGKSAAKRASRKLIKMNKLCILIRKSLILQRQFNANQY